MATTAQINKYIDTIGPIIQKYAKKYGYKYPSAIIAQSCRECGYGTDELSTKYHNYFGIKCGSKWKGKSVNLKTHEEYTPGVSTLIKDNFRVYDSMEEGVIGYFEFLGGLSRYANLKSATSPRDYFVKIVADGYCTSSTYIDKNMDIVNKRELTKFDPVSTVYYPRYTGTSTRLDVVLKAIGVPDSLTGSAQKRKPLAVLNGIGNYSGSAQQNLKLVDLAKKGLLIKSK